MNQPKPLIIAHRGASGHAPENTMKAFELAYKHGADGIELDVHFTKDRRIVVTHDPDTGRLAGKKYVVGECTLRQLRRLDFGEGEKIPTLDDVLSRYASKFKIINIEIKSESHVDLGLEAELIKLIWAHNAAKKVIVSCFNPLVLMRLKKIDDRIPRGFLISPHVWVARQGVWAHLLAPTSFNLDENWCTPKRLASYRRYKKQIWVWTVNDKENMAHWIEQKADAIITNYPKLLREMLYGKNRRRSN